MINTTKMIKITTKNGTEYAFGKPHKTEYEWQIKVYKNGKYSEACTIYGDTKDDVVNIMNYEIKNSSK
jgi:hypothetical protein